MLMAKFVALFVLMWLLKLGTEGMSSSECVSNSVQLLNKEPRDGGGVAGDVEYCHHGQWNRLCHSSEERNNGVGEVACMQLGYGNFSVSGAMESPIPSLECVGTNESTLLRCTENNNCSMSNLRIVCTKVVDCSMGQVRLNNVSDDSQLQLVEVCVDGRWGTVQTSQPQRVAEVVCGNGQHSLFTWSTSLDIRFLLRYSRAVHHCSLNGSGPLTCHNTTISNHSLDLGVVCVPNNLVNCKENQFRLVGGSIHREGRVEVCMNGHWGTVCNNSQEGIAGTVCSQLGYSETSALRRQFTSGTGEIYCCYQNASCSPCTEHQCDHSMDMGVVCEPRECSSTTPPASIEDSTDSTTSEPKECLGTTKPVVSSVQSESNSAESQDTVVTSLASVVGILVVSLMVTAAGWTVTCVVWRRKDISGIVHEQSSSGFPAQGQRSVSLRQLDDKLYNEALSTVPNPGYSSLGPQYDSVEGGLGEGTYDVIDHSQQQTPQAAPANPTSEGDDKKRDDFYDADDHTYSVVNVKHKKKASKKPSEDLSGEGEGPTQCEDERTAQEGYSRLHHNC